MYKIKHCKVTAKMLVMSEPLWVSLSSLPHHHFFVFWLIWSSRFFFFFLLDTYMPYAVACQGGSLSKSWLWLVLKIFRRTWKYTVA